MKPAIRWEEVRRRLQASEDSLRDALSESPERIKNTYRRRAVQLAQSHAGNKAVSKGIPALIFRLAQERYAVALNELMEVLPFRTCTPVPGGAPLFLGVINLRGEMRPLIDLSRVLSGSSAPTESGSILILRRQAALKVDEVEELREIQTGELSPPAHGQFLQGTVSGRLGLLDVETVLSAVFAKECHPL